jgi:hypothetical protein
MEGCGSCVGVAWSVSGQNPSPRRSQTVMPPTNHGRYVSHGDTRLPASHLDSGAHLPWLVLTIFICPLDEPAGLKWGRGSRPQEIRTASNSINPVDPLPGGLPSEPRV